MRSLLGFLGSKYIHYILCGVMLVVPMPFMVGVIGKQHFNDYIGGVGLFYLPLLMGVCYCWNYANKLFANENRSDKNDVTTFQVLLGLTNLSVCSFFLYGFTTGQNLPTPDKILDYIQLFANFVYA